MEPLGTPRRRNTLRLHNYDYSAAGAYFATICSYNRECLFGEIRDSRMVLNDAGRILNDVWDDLPNHYDHVLLDAFIIMPNHVHGIVILRDPVADAIVGAGFVRAGFVRAGLKPAPTHNTMKTEMKRHGLPEIVRGFKTFSSRRINEMRKTPGMKLWQRNYYEHVIRNDRSLAAIREYIVNNPRKWELDRENPNRHR